MPVRCVSCGKQFPNATKINLHLGKSQSCQLYYDQQSTELASSSAAKDNQETNEGEPDFFLDPPDFTLPYRSPSPVDPSVDHPRKRQRVNIEDVEDMECGSRNHEKFPGLVAEVVDEGVTMYQDLLEEQIAMKRHSWAPFGDEEEWQLAKWLMRNVGHSAIDDYLKLPIVSRSSCISDNQDKHLSVDERTYQTDFSKQNRVLQEDRLVTHRCKVDL